MALGGSCWDLVDVSFRCFRPQPGDRFRLCSDGLSDELHSDDIKDLLATVQSPDVACQSLIDLACERGGRDNVTVIVVDRIDRHPDPAMDLHYELAG